MAKIIKEKEYDESLHKLENFIESLGLSVMEVKLLLQQAIDKLNFMVFMEGVNNKIQEIKEE